MAPSSTDTGAATPLVAGRWGHLFDGATDFSPDTVGGVGTPAFDAFLKTVPARWVVYLMVGEGDVPVQLLSVKNLRHSLKRRLGGEAPPNAAAPTESNPAATDPAAPAKPGLTKRVDYRQLVRRVYWKRVDSRFEADLAYLEAARAVFPGSYEKMTGFRPAWFVHVDDASPFPRYVRTADLSDRPGVLVGPIEGKEAAGRLVELIESAFDLCRYHQVLTQAPKGKACAYKEMGRCPAPCDGSVSMGQYRRMVELSVKVLADPADTVREHEIRMRQAAGELRFETAGRIKQYVDELSQLQKGPYRVARRLEEFQYVSLQRGPREGVARVFLVSPGLVTEEAGLIGDAGTTGPLVRVLLERAEPRRTPATDTPGAERIAVVTAHLLTTKNTSGVFIPLPQLDEKSLLRAYRDLMKQKPQEETTGTEEEEGVLKELQGGA